MTKRKYQHLLELIVNSEAKQMGDFHSTAKLAAELLCQQLLVTHVGVAIISCENNTISPVANYGHISPAEFLRPAPDLCPKYIAELRTKRLIDAFDTRNDSRLCELSSNYFTPNGVRSTLDIAIRINGHLEGVLFLERMAFSHWSDSEIQIASQVADQLALTLATRDAYDKEEKLTLLLNAAEHSDQVTMLINLKTEIVEYVNQAHEIITGKSKSSVIGSSLQELSFVSQHPDETRVALTQVKLGIAVKGENKIVKQDGSQSWIRYSVKQFITDRGNCFALLNAEDCSEEHKHKVELEKLAWRCRLTDLYNRTYFTKELEKVRKGYLLLIDLRGFKRFNDTYGHESGDLLLIEIARRLRHFGKVNHTELLARVGSDEFAIILPEMNLEDLEYTTSRLYRQITLPVAIGREQIEPKPALAIVDIEGIEAKFLPLACADIALQYAKKKQGDAIQVFNNSLLNTFKANAEIERDLQTALRGREFELYYQPLKDLQKRAYIGAEALIRWHHPKKGVLYPGAFIDIAEQTGHINAIGAWVLEAACKQLNLWQHHNINLSMHVNVAARQFFSGNLYDQVWALITRYRLKPGSLILEITETELMEDIKYATNLCKELTELGVGLAIDDFGTGYSSMRYLKQFPISKLKIDRSFISDLSVSHESQEIVSAIIAMASALNISLTAEGVETKEQELFLADHHCHQAQGFLYSPALRESEFSQFLEQDSFLSSC
ncbi:sensor domain-containing phosphodiesterase [Shewanella nanhaiensis]|uniref:EAL domain-containing protein n=1 Tax=Shewanella nanhaiensis TaxID=2864872 RepID=A0ABS7E533_9GAMM|nr:EAL domain-containing protein [Shewanella nanhaiensis]